jgi:hypothetical protein
VRSIAIVIILSYRGKVGGVYPSDSLKTRGQR